MLFAARMGAGCDVPPHGRPSGGDTEFRATKNNNTPPVNTFSCYDINKIIATKCQTNNGYYKPALIKNSSKHFFKNLM